MDMFYALKKKEALIARLEKLPSLLIAFSGGVDSTFLLAVAVEALPGRVTAATASSFIHPPDDKKRSVEYTRTNGIEHIVFKTDEISIPGFKENLPDRCYHCKKALCASLREIAEDRGTGHIAHAINTDDLGDYRPGIKAAEEAGLIAPLVDAGLSKDEIRYLSKKMGLITWDKPSMACLASRIPYGSEITIEKISMIERGEKILADEGFRQYRVRHHDTTARIEVEENEIYRLFDRKLKGKLILAFKEIGFKHLAVDLEGFRSGSMNRVLDL